MNRIHAFRIRRQSGFSLIELMVASLLGVIIIAGMIQIFISTRVTYNVTEGLSRVQESARFALATINHDVRMAAGGAPCGGTRMVVVDRSECTTDPDVGLIRICSHLDDNTPIQAMLTGGGLTVFEAQGTGTGGVSYTLDQPGDGTWDQDPGADLVELALPGRDIIMFSSLSLISPNLTACEQGQNPNGQSVNICENDGSPGRPQDYGLQQDDIALALNCSTQTGDAFASRSNGSNLVRSGQGNQGGGNWSHRYGPGASIFRLNLVAYYIGQSAAGDDRPALFRAARQGDTWITQELADGIDNMQVFLRSNNGPWQPAPLANANAVRVHLIASSPEEVDSRELTSTMPLDNNLVLTIDDRRVRHSYSNAIAIRELNLPVDGN